MALRNYKAKNSDIVFWLKRWDGDHDGKFSKDEFTSILIGNQVEDKAPSAHHSRSVSRISSQQNESVCRLETPVKTQSLRHKENNNTRFTVSKPDGHSLFVFEECVPGQQSRTEAKK